MGVLLFQTHINSFLPSIFPSFRLAVRCIYLCCFQPILSPCLQWCCILFFLSFSAPFLTGYIHFLPLTNSAPPEQRLDIVRAFRKANRHWFDDPPFVIWSHLLYGFYRHGRLHRILAAWPLSKGQLASLNERHRPTPTTATATWKLMAKWTSEAANSSTKGERWVFGNGDIYCWRSGQFASNEDKGI